MGGMKSGVALESVDVIVVVFSVNFLWTASVATIINKFAEMLSCTLFAASHFFLQNLLFFLFFRRDHIVAFFFLDHRVVVL